MFISKINAKILSDYTNANSLGSKFRSNRIKPLLKMIEDVYKKKGKVAIADVGGTEEYWNIIPNHFLHYHAVKITIINLPDFLPENDHGIFTFVGADACDLSCFENNFFDIAHSNSVIEHVGDWNKKVMFANEIKRIASKYFIQTPNYWFPIEPHCMTPFFHWLPRPFRVFLVMHFQLGHWTKSKSIGQAVRVIENVQLLNNKMMKELFDDGEIKIERFFLLPKSMILIKE